MKTLPLYLAAVAALAACSSDEVVNTGGGGDADDEIVFATDVTASRGASVNTQSIESNGFWVKAINADDGTDAWGQPVKFELKGDKSAYAAVIPDGQNIDMRWRNKNLKFYATNLDPASYQFTQNTITDNSATNTYWGYENFNSPADIAQHIDFVYATNKGTHNDFSGAVPLNFKHAFVQIEVKAKCTSEVYTVKVKGYKLNYADLTGKFNFADPTVVGSTSDLAATEPDGMWTTVNNGWRVFDSGFYNGFATSDGIRDETTDGFITLDGEERTISNGTDSGSAFLIPTGDYSDYDHLDGDANGGYLALLVQIDYKNDNSPLFPACLVTPDNDLTNNLSTRVSYSGLPKYYGYIYTPLHIDWSESAGKKITYVLDLSDGLGYVGPIKPSVVDPTKEGYNATDGTATADSEAALADNRDPFSNKQQVLGSDMGVTVTVSEREDITENPSMSHFP